MKKNSLFRLWYLLLPVMLMSSISVRSQSAIFSGNQKSEHSVIRNYKDHVDITFNVMLDTQTFNYVDRNLMTTHSVYIDNFRVNDFVVYHDSVFFCGCVGEVACYGYFDISNVFFNSGNITYFVLNIPTMFNPNRSKLYSLEKIDVTTSRSGATHMLMTGLGYNYDVNVTHMGSHYYYPGAIVEAWTDSSGAHRMKYTIDYDYNYFYTDVTFTNKYAVIAASTTEEYSSRKHSVFRYINPSYSGDGYLDSWGSSPSVTPILTADTNILSVPPLGASTVFITRMQYDTFATACMNYLSGNVTVSIYQDPSQQPFKRIDIPYSHYCDEIVYNSFQQSLYYISHSAAPSYPYDLYQIQSPFTMSLRIIEGTSRWLSLDNTDNEKKVILSGFDFSTVFVYPKKYWLFDENNLNGCFQIEEVQNNELNKTDRDGLYTQTIIRDERPPILIRPKSTNYNLDYLCQ